MTISRFNKGDKIALSGDVYHEVKGNRTYCGRETYNIEFAEVAREDLYRICKKCAKGKARYEFYTSNEWSELKVEVFKLYPHTCMKCGKTKETDCAVIHVDHIKPRSKYPELSLDINNMQVLCGTCNIIKSDRDETDYR